MRSPESLLLILAASTASAATVNTNKACPSAAAASISASVSSKIAASVSAKVAASVSSKVSASVSSKVSASVSASVSSKVAASIASSLSAKSSTKASTSAKTTAKPSSVSSKTSFKGATSSSKKTSSSAAQTTLKTSSVSSKSSAKTTSSSSKSLVKTSPTSSSVNSSSAAVSTQSTSAISSTQPSSSAISPSLSSSASSSASSSSSSSASSFAPVPTDPALIKYVVAPIPNFSGSSNYSEENPYAESDHFRIWGQNNENTTAALVTLEGTWDCFINRLGWRSSGLPAANSDGQPPYYKTSYFVYPGLVDIRHATGTTVRSRDGLGYVWIDPDYVSAEATVSHEYGHVMTIAEPQFWNQSNTFGWAETIAQYVAETYSNHPICSASRVKVNATAEDGTRFWPNQVIGESYRTLVDATNSPTGLGNQYTAWPFLSYLTYNLDNYAGFGADTMLNMFKSYKVNSNETPFHAFDRMAAAAGTSIQAIVGRYWSRMAFGDYGSEYAANYIRWSDINYNNTYVTGDNSYRVYSTRAPRYMGASFVPLNNMTSSVTATVTAQTAYTAYIAVQGADYETVRYAELVAAEGEGIVKTVSVDVANGEEAMLVVANTPSSLLMYDATNVGSGPVSVGLDFTFTLDGATN